MLSVSDRLLTGIEEPLSGPIVQVAPAPAVPPRGFVHSIYRHEWLLGRPRAEVWQWLADPATLVDSQTAPYRSELVETGVGTGEHAEGAYQGQSGPMMSLSGVLAAVEPDRYRDVQYFFGSYVGSRALFRPTRLQFWLDDGPGSLGTVLRVRLDAHVRRRAQGAWERIMESFWTRFGRAGARCDRCHWLH